MRLLLEDDLERSGIFVQFRVNFIQKNLKWYLSSSSNTAWEAQLLLLDMYVKL